jgi:hypothetical protein
LTKVAADNNAGSNAATSEISQKKRRRTPSYSPESAASFVRRSVASSRACREARGRVFCERRALLRWAQKYEKVVESDYFADLRFITKRGEHTVYKDHGRALAIKASHAGQFGYSLRAEGASATPLEYLERLAWQNHIFGDDIRIIGVTGGDRLMRNCNISTLDYGTGTCPSSH